MKFNGTPCITWARSTGKYTTLISEAFNYLITFFIMCQFLNTFYRSKLCKCFYSNCIECQESAIGVWVHYYLLPNYTCSYPGVLLCDAWLIMFPDTQTYEEPSGDVGSCRCNTLSPNNISVNHSQRITFVL